MTIIKQCLSGHYVVCINTRATDTQYNTSKISEKLGWCGRQNMLRPYLKIWAWEWIFRCAVKAISSLGVRSPWYSQKTVFYGLKRRRKKMRILLQNAFNSKVKFQLGVDLPSLPEDYPLSYTGKPSIIDHIFWLLKVFEKVRSRINHTANIYYGLLWWTNNNSDFTANPNPVRITGNSL